MAHRRETPSRECAVTLGLSEMSTSRSESCDEEYSTLYSGRNSYAIPGTPSKNDNPISGNASPPSSLQKSAEKPIRKPAASDMESIWPRRLMPCSQEPQPNPERLEPPQFSMNHWRRE